MIRDDRSAAVIFFVLFFFFCRSMAKNSNGWQEVCGVRGMATLIIIIFITTDRPTAICRPRKSSTQRTPGTVPGRVDIPVDFAADRPADLGAEW